MTARALNCYAISQPLECTGFDVRTHKHSLLVLQSIIGNSHAGPSSYLFSFWFSESVPLRRHDLLGIHSVDHADLELLEIHLPLPPHSGIKSMHHHPLSSLFSVEALFSQITVDCVKLT